MALVLRRSEEERIQPKKSQQDNGFYAVSLAILITRTLFVIQSGSGATKSDGYDLTAKLLISPLFRRPGNIERFWLLRVEDRLEMICRLNVLRLDLE